MNSHESPRPARASTESRDRGGVEELQQYLNEATIIYQDGTGALTELKAQPDPATRLDEVKCSVTLRELQSLKVKVRKLVPSAGTHVVPTEQVAQAPDAAATNIRTEVQRALETAVLEENKRMLILQQVICDRDGFFGTRAQTIVYSEADLIPLTDEDAISDYTVLISKILGAIGSDAQVSPEVKLKVCEDYRLSQATCQLMIDNRSLYSSDATARITDARSRAQAESDLAREREMQKGGTIVVKEEPLDPEAIEEASEDIEGKIQGYREQARETLTIKRKGVVDTLGKTISAQVALSATGVKVEIFSDYGNRSIEDTENTQLVKVLQNAIDDAQENKIKALAMSGLVNVTDIVRKYQTGTEYPALLGKAARLVAVKTHSSSLYDHLERNRQQAIEEMRLAIAIQKNVEVDDVTPEEATSVLNDPGEVIALGNALARMGENIAGTRSLRHPLRGGQSLADELIAQLQLLKLHVEKCGAWAGELRSAIQGYDQRLAALDLGEQLSDQIASNGEQELPQAQIQVADTEEVPGDIHDSVIDGSNSDKDFNGAHFGAQHGDPEAESQAQTHADDSEEVLGDMHDSVLSGPSATTDSDGTHFGDQSRDPEAEPPPKDTTIQQEEIIRETTELSHPGFEKLEPPHTYDNVAHEGSLIEEWKEEGIQVEERGVSWGIHPITDRIMPRMWVFDISAGGDAQGEALDVNGNKNVFEHGDFALVAIAQPAGTEPNRTWNIRAELLQRIPEDDTLQSRREVLMQNLARIQVLQHTESTTADLAHLQSECDEILQQYRSRFLESGMSESEVDARSEVSDLVGLAKIIHGLVSAGVGSKQEATPIEDSSVLVNRRTSNATQLPSDFAGLASTDTARTSEYTRKPTDASVGLQVGLRSFANHEYESALDTFRRAWDGRLSVDVSNGTDVNIALRVLEAAEQVIGSRFAKSQNVQAHINFINEFIPQMQAVYATVVGSGVSGDDLINRIHRLYNYPVTQYEHIDDALHLACIDAEIQCLQALNGDTAIRAQHYESLISEKSRIDQGLATKDNEAANAQFQQRLNEALTNIPEAFRDPARRLYEVAWDGLHAELAVVRKVGEVAGDSHIPFLGPAFAGFAEFIQGTFTLRNLETGLITPKSRIEARRHFVNWITSSIEGGIDLAGFVTGGGSEIEAIRMLFTGNNDRNVLLPRIISLIACRGLERTSPEDSPGMVSTIGRIARALLQDNEIAEGIATDLLADQRFTGFVDKLKEHLQRSPPLTSRT